MNQYVKVIWPEIIVYRDAYSMYSNGLNHLNTYKHESDNSIKIVEI